MEKLKNYLNVGSKYNTIYLKILRHKNINKNIESNEYNWKRIKCFMIPALLYFVFDSLIANQFFEYLFSIRFPDFDTAPFPFNLSGHAGPDWREALSHDFLLNIAIMIKTGILMGFVLPSALMAHDEENPNYKKVLKTTITAVTTMAILGICLPEVTLLFHSLIYVVSVIFWVTMTVGTLNESYSYSKKQKNLKKDKINKKELDKLEKEIEIIRKNWRITEDELLNDEKGMLTLIEYIHNDDKYYEEVDSDYNNAVEQEQMKQLYEHSIKNKSSEEAAKELFIKQFHENKNPIINS